MFGEIFGSLFLIAVVCGLAWLVRSGIRDQRKFAQMEKARTSEMEQLIAADLEPSVVGKDNGLTNCFHIELFGTSLHVSPGIPLSGNVVSLQGRRGEYDCPVFIAPDHDPPAGSRLFSALPRKSGDGWELVSAQNPSLLLVLVDVPPVEDDLDGSSLCGSVFPGGKYLMIGQSGNRELYVVARDAEISIAPGYRCPDRTVRFDSGAPVIDVPKGYTEAAHVAL